MKQEGLGRVITRADGRSSPPAAGNGRAAFLLGLFAALEEEGLTPCVVGHWEGLPERVDGDVDIVLGRMPAREVARTVSRVAERYGARLVQSLRHEPAAISFVVRGVRAEGCSWYLVADLCTDYVRKGRRFLSAQELLATRRPATDGIGRPLGFQVLDPAHAFIYYLIKKIEKRALDDRHGDHLCDLWRANRTGARRALDRFWPARDAELLSRAAEDEDWIPVRQDLDRFRLALHAFVPRDGKLVAGELRRVFQRLLRPTGLCIAVIGPDGSGKSTLIKALSRSLRPAFRATATFHTRPSLIRGLVPPTNTAVRPQERPPRGQIASLAKLGYYLVDAVFGYWLHVYPALVRSTLVISDRYFHDLLVDPRRSRYGGSLRLARWASRMVPRPDLWILLDAPPAAIEARKQELPSAELVRQRQAYLDLAGRMPNAVVLDARASVAEVTDAATNIVYAHLIKRERGRMS